MNKEKKKRLHLGNSLTPDAWIEIMSRLTYPSIVDACREARCEQQDDGMWKRIVFHKHPRLGYYAGILQELIPGWRVDKWSAIDRDLWILRQHYIRTREETLNIDLEHMTLRPGLYQDSRLDEKENERIMKTLRDDIIDAKEKLRSSSFASSLFAAKTPDIDTINGIIVNSRYIRNLRMLRNSMFHTTVPLLLILSAEMGRDKSIVENLKHMLDLEIELGLDVTASIVSKYSSKEFKVKYLNAHIATIPRITDVRE